MDGLGDRPIPELGNLTPLEAAKTPNMDLLAKKGATGFTYVAGLGLTPGSDVGHLSLFGYDYHKYYSGRGPIEAVGLGVKLGEGDVAFRGNFATEKDGTIIDRRAGRLADSGPFAAALTGMKIEDISIEVKAGTAHRAAVVFRGPGLSPNIGPTDPHGPGTAHTSEPLDGTPEAIKTARILNAFHARASEILAALPENAERIKNNKLPANLLLVRGAGLYTHIPQFQDKYGMTCSCVAGGGLYKGVGSLLGMEVLEVAGATGKLDTDLNAKVRAVMAELDRGVEFVFMHAKGTDICSHDGDAQGKKAFIERVDEAIAPLLSVLDHVLVVVTGDHSTPCALKDHSGDAVPILFAGEGVRNDDVERFGERACVHGAFPSLLGLDIMKVVNIHLGRAPYMGA